ncbi:hypothetical protein Fcan01_17939 [Folsomia candida]|uniref:Uncharacterized protein n=1 Tax=Folsomia candida TaxID=158441 RepID=A0A226DR02_FOLCA|nr:hypothetical protein Fcan01_17939 [Folsomia candida]
MSKVKDSAVNSREATTSVLAVNLQALPSSRLGVLPPMNCMRRTVQRARQAAQIHPVVARTRSEIPDLSGRFLANDGEDFLKIVTISTPNERALVFCTKKIWTGFRRRIIGFVMAHSSPPLHFSTS